MSKLADKIVSISRVDNVSSLVVNKLLGDWLEEHQRYILVEHSRQIVFVCDIEKHKDDTELPLVSLSEARRFIEEWSSNIATPEFEVKVWFNEELRVKALSQEEYGERVRVKKIMEEEEKRQRKDVEREKKLESEDKKVKTVKKSHLDWDNLEEMLQKCSLNDVAKEMGCSSAAVRRQAKIKGIVLPKGKRGRKRKDESNT